MDPLGITVLIVVVAAGGFAAITASRWAVVAALAGWWVAVVVLAARFVQVDLRLAEVAALTRDEVPAALRIAGVWAGPAGSVLCWFAVVTTVVLLGTGRWSARLVGAASAVGGLAVLFVAGPFDRVAEPVLAGRGLNPVLEHPMMLVHPPLLYLSQAVVLTTALVTRSPTSRPPDPRRWAAAAAALLTVSTLLGAWWAHDELGWGGWWAWDPVENTALAPLVALLASLHARSALAARRWRDVAAIAVLLGIALTRSGLPRSVHAFASARALALVFALAAIAWIVATTRSVRQMSTETPTSAEQNGVGRVERIAAMVTAVGAGWVLVVIGAAGVAAAVLGSQDPPAAIDGQLLGRLIAPVGVVGVGALILFGFRRGHRWWSLLAHAGALVFALGVVGSVATSSELGTVVIGTPQRIGGSTVTVESTRIDEERQDLVRLEVVATLDGRRVTAAILDHPDLARTRSRPGRVVDLWGETELVVLTVRGDRVRVEVRRNPGLLQVWIGGAVCAVGLGGAACQSRRRRLASSNASSVEAGAPLEPAD